MINTTSNAIDRFEPNDRKCYKDSEFHFKYLKWSEGYRYSNKNCLYEAVIENIIDDCQCLPSFAMARKPGVNFINVLCSPFSYESDLQSFSIVTVWLCNFFSRILAQKLAACKMLIKLTTNVNSFYGRCSYQKLASLTNIKDNFHEQLDR